MVQADFDETVLRKLHGGARTVQADPLKARGINGGQSSRAENFQHVDRSPKELIAARA